MSEFKVYDLSDIKVHHSVHLTHQSFGATEVLGERGGGGGGREREREIYTMYVLYLYTYNCMYMYMYLAHSSHPLLEYVHTVDYFQQVFELC